MNWKKILGYLGNPILWVSLAIITALIVAYKLVTGGTHVYIKNKKFNLIHDEAYYKRIADSLVPAMDQGTWLPGTDELTMLKLLTPLNADELIEVYNQFGTKRNTDTGFWFEKEPKNLFGWFEEELSGADLLAMKAVWSKTNLWP